LGTQGTKRRQTKHKTQQRKLKRSPTRIHHKTGLNPGGREGQAVAASQKKPDVLLTYIVKSDKSIVRDRGKKKIYAKKKRSIVI